MGLIIASPEEVQEYYDMDKMSQSKMKLLLKGMDNFLSNRDTSEEELYYSEVPHFIIGKGVDTKLTAQSHIYENDYYISQIEVKPSEVEMSILNMVFDDVTDSYPPHVVEEEGFEFEALSQYRGSILSACDEHGWQSRWKDETRINKIIEVGTAYFEDLKRAYGKTVLSQEQDLLISDIAMSLESNLRTSAYFNRELYMHNNILDMYYQLPIYFEYMGIECKALLDMLIVEKNENGKIIKVIPVDLKTMSGNTINFMTSVKARRYDIQAGWYTLAVAFWLQQQGYTSNDVQIDNFRFVVESTTQPGSPLVYECDYELLDIGKNGRPEIIEYIGNDSTSGYPIKYKEVKGYDQLLDEYLWFEDNDWKEEKVVKENNGFLKINWNGIIT